MAYLTYMTYTVSYNQLTLPTNSRLYLPVSAGACNKQKQNQGGAKRAKRNKATVPKTKVRIPERRGINQSSRLGPGG